ncbi:MAG: T9SS type A sorting domain-containing protein [candidate division Zixibacteria bacterium]|nr:T9SS type A sorting domain-containing protein [candidate division Zixibacteria bacterium]
MKFKAVNFLFFAMLAILFILSFASAKENEQSHKAYPPMTLDSGGPDAFGYTWIDSDEPGGPVFGWIDIADIGTPLTLGDDDNQGPFDIGFDFTFYENTFTSVNICSNGWITFIGTENEYLNTSIPDTSRPNNLLSVFWDDLAPNNGGEVYYYSDSEQGIFVISYDGVPYYFQSGALHFQVILHDNGDIVYQYGSMADAGHGNNSATIGIEDAMGTVGLQVCCNQAYIHGDMAILFNPPAAFDFDAAPTAFVSPAGFGQVDNPFTPAVAYANLGTQRISFDVSLIITFNEQEVYRETGVINSLDPESEIDYSFPDYNPINEGTYMLSAISFFEADEDTANDVLNYDFLVLSTNLPPQDLAAVSNQDSEVPLEWSEPGGSACSTIVYDDGVIDNMYYFCSAENISASRFAAVAPIEIHAVWVHVLTLGDTQWPWPDDAHDPVEIGIWQGCSNPETQIYSEITTCSPGEDINLFFDPPLICSTDEMWVSFNNTTNVGPYDALCLDAYTDYPENKWARISGTWSLYSNIDGDNFIRASIRSNGNNIVLTPANPYMDDNPVALDTELLLGYNLYRSLTPDVPVDEEHKINSGYLGETEYNDNDVENGVTYYYVCTAVYDNDGDIEESEPSNEVSATPCAPGELIVNPYEISDTVDFGGIAYIALTLTNDGGLPVNFSIETTTEDRLYTADAPYRHGIASAKRYSNSSEYDKSCTAPDKRFLPVALGFGGPDEFGYKWIDSDEPNGASFNWLDIAGYGSPLYMADDDNQGPFNMAFQFPFYGQTFSSFRICSNGFISFTSDDNDYNNGEIPASDSPENLIAPFWEDLAPNDGGMIYWLTNENMTVVSYVDVPAYDYGNGTGPFTFQVIFYPDGKIKYQYLDMNPPFDYCTIGIQDASGTIGLQVVCNAPYVHNDLAIILKAGWLSVNTSSGVVPAGGEFEVGIIMNASDLDEGAYYGDILICSYDENHQLDDIDVPATLIVGDTTGIENENIALTAAYSLSQNYPNPFNAQTAINFALPEASDVELSVYNILGQKVATLVDGFKQAGYHTVSWKAVNVSSGIYYYKITTGDFIKVNQMTLLK